MEQKKSAVMLMTLGEDQAAEVFKHLNPKEVQQLSMAVSNMRQISNNELAEVLTEFEESAIQFAALNINTNDYLRSVLVKALGEERAASLLEDIFEKQETTSGIESLNYMEPQTVADIIRDEHPQIIATILVHLKRNLAADPRIIRRAPTQRYYATYRHLWWCPTCCIGGIDRSVEQLTGWPKPQTQQNGWRENCGRNHQLDESQQEESVIDAMRDYDGELAQRIIDEMFLFENLIEVDNRSIQRICRMFHRAGYCPQSSNQALRDHFLNNMAARAAEIVRDDLESRSPVRMSRGKRTKSHFAYRSSFSRKRRNRDRWWRRRLSKSTIPNDQWQPWQLS